MSKIRIQTIVKRVRKLAEEYPEARYVTPDRMSTKCYYRRGTVENGPPTEGCIMGHALRGLIQLTDDDETKSIRDVLERRENRIPHDEDAIEWLATVQGCQDSGDTWSDAVKRADMGME